MVFHAPIPPLISLLGARLVWQGVSLTAPMCLSSNPAAIALDRRL